MTIRNNTFILKRSNVVNKIPVLSGLTLGELALNTADAKLYSLYTSGLSGATEVRQIGWDRLSISGGTLYGQTYYSFGTGWTQNQTISYISAATGNVLVTKEWVENLATDTSGTVSVNVATTTVLPACTYNNGVGGVGATLTRNTSGTTGTIDGITIGLADRILVKNQASQIQNGVYEVTVVGSVSTPFVLTRTVDSDETSELDPQIVIASRGTQAGLRFAQTTADPVIGTNNIVYSSVGSTFVTQNAAGTQTSGNIPFWTTTARDLNKGTTNLFWNNTNKRLGIGTGTPTATIHSKGIDSSSSNYGLKVQNSGGTDNLVVRNDGVISGDGFAGNSFQLGSYNPVIEGDLSVGRAEKDSNTIFTIVGANYPRLYFDSVYSTKISLTSGAGGQYLLLSDNVNPKFTWLSSTNIGINFPSTASTINAELEVLGKTKTDTLQVTSGATTGYILTALDSNGNATWSSPSSLSGITSIDTFVTGFTYSNNNFVISQNQGQSPLSVNVSVMTGLTISNSGVNVLTVVGSGSSTTAPIFTVQGSSGELFSVTDSLTGSLFSVNDISGLPILEVFSDNTILMGSYLAPSLNTTVKTTANSGSTTIYSIPTSAYTGAFFEYTVNDGTNLRAGSIMSIWSGSTINYTETSTTDIGNTNPITFNMAVSSGLALLRTSATTNSWTVKTIVRSI